MSSSNSKWASWPKTQQTELTLSGVETAVIVPAFESRVWILSFSCLNELQCYFSSEYDRRRDTRDVFIAEGTLHLFFPGSRICSYRYWPISLEIRTVSYTYFRLAPKQQPWTQLFSMIWLWSVPACEAKAFESHLLLYLAQVHAKGLFC